MGCHCRVYQRVRQRIGFKPNQAEPAAQRPWWGDLGANVLALLLFLARKIVFIVMTTTVIMTLVVIAQKLFDVGTLSIVHLVAMVLLAELLGWTGLVSKLIFRRAGA